MVTIAIQVYWNVQNYKTNKQRLINEVQISLDNGVEQYYAQLAKTDFFAFVEDPKDTVLKTAVTIKFLKSKALERTMREIDSTYRYLGDSTRQITGFTQILDSGKGFTHMKSGENSSVSVFRGKKLVDSINVLQGLANKIIVSITRDSIDFKKLDTIFNAELKRKNISIEYKIKHFKNDSAYGNISSGDSRRLVLSTISKSTYLQKNEKLELLFTNPTLTILKRSLTGILLSAVLSACIITCLLYLLRIINKQKELAEIKNDLISNITHEFKTPIATISTAIEGIKNFNDSNDKEKTDNYLDISEQQLQKLHQMVEKLLETAMLDGDKVFIQKEKTDLVLMIKKIVEKPQAVSSKQTILFKHNVAHLVVEADPFHFENALTNLIDNALKYGGSTVEVNLNSLLSSVEIIVADNGGGIEKNQREKIFDKFYRIPKGNLHDVKGFGIGLFYTKKIIEKHGGTIALVPDTKDTIFRITL